VPLFSHSETNLNAIFPFNKMYKILIGLVQPVKINGHKFMAKMDTGARYNSISKDLANSIGLGPVIKVVNVRSSFGTEERGMVKAKLEIAGIEYDTNFNLAERSHLRYPILLGLEILKKGFIIDPSLK